MMKKGFLIKIAAIAAIIVASMNYGSASTPSNNEELTFDSVYSEYEDDATDYYKVSDELVLNYTPEEYDSLIAVWYEQNVANSFDEFFRDFIDLDPNAEWQSDIPDSVYIARLKMIVSPISMSFNDVTKKHIIAYTTNRKGIMARMLGLSKVYFPMIEEELAAADLPLELRIIPIIESALNPTAVSRMGATGLWQFMYGTGKHYGLEVTSFVDERRDPVASTKAACNYFKLLYKMYGDWTLAIAAYNCGPGNVNKALKRAGENARTFWDIYPHLPRETRGYIPAFIGATYAYTFHKQHSIEPIAASLPISTDTVHVNNMMHFDQIASTLGTPVEILRELNPQYKMDIIPAVEKSYVLTLPQADIAKYLNYEEEILAKDSIYLAKYIKKDPVTNSITYTQPVASASKGAIEYRIKSGDTLGSVAKKYGVTVAQIMKWNNIKNANRLSIGQRIQIHK